MAPEATPARLAYRIVDSNTGAEVVRNLAHLHQSAWTVRALQRGYPGSATIGDFRIPLPAPYSDDHNRNRAQYDLLAVGQKVEGYLGDVVTGSPRVSGVITKLSKPLGRPWEIAGADTLWWLQQSQLLPGEILSGLTGANIVSNYRTTQEVVWDDDFSGWNSGGSGNYTNSGGWSFTSSDPYLGLPAMTSTTVSPSQAVLTTTSSWTPEYDSGSTVTIHGTMVAGTDSSADAGEACILLLSDATGANGVMVRARMLQTGASTGIWNVHAEIHTIASGVFTLQSQVLNVFQNVGNLFRFEVTAVGYSSGGFDYYRLLINGKDPNCVFSRGSSGPTGRIGLRFGPAAGGSPAVYVNRLQFHSRIRFNVPSRFAAGTVAGGSVSPPQAITSSGQTHLDMILLASVLDGWWIRKNPGVGNRADSIDYGPSPGSDLSSAIVFEEGVNILDQDTNVSAVADLFATDVRMQALPGLDSGGNVTWSRIGAIGDMALVDSAYDVGVPSFGLLMAYAQQIQNRKANPMQAVQVRVVRTADTADKWRELDFVTVHIPTLGVYRQKAQVVGYTLDEGDNSQIAYLNQFPERTLPQAPLQRTVRALDYLTSLFATR